VLWRWRLTPHYRWSLRVWWPCLIEAYPFALTSIIAMVYTRLDLVLLSLWHGDVAAGWYSAAYKLWEAIGLVPSSLLDALFPEMSRLAGSREGDARLRSLFRTSRWAMLGGGAVLAAGGTLGASWLIALVYGQEGDYVASVPAFRILVWAVPAMFLYLLSGHVLYAVGEQRQVTRAMLTVGLLNVAMNLLVIPRWNYLGASAVALISEWLLWGLLYSRARRALTVT
jgi:O-antigen/teichoic acid export membrane protein